MAAKLLIVHGYSDGSTSFTALGDFVVANGLYGPRNVFYLNYASMDDEATFRDFADKLDADHRDRLGGEKVDVICHSTGSLVVRAWLALHARRCSGRGLQESCPIDRLVCLAPANFGSDLTGLGQSFLGKVRSTFFNSNHQREDFLESGKAVLQGLEPASPFQWELSFDYDLHSNLTYFSPTRPDHQRCYPFVLAAGEAYGGVEAKVIKQRGLPGTDGTVRIAGTSLNTRACSLDFRANGTKLIWWPQQKFDSIPFAVFAGFNHGSIVNPAKPGFAAPDGPGTLLLDALRTPTTLETYAAHSDRFSDASSSNAARLPRDRQECYQQFFFRVRDDAGLFVKDFYIDFHVATRDDRTHEALTMEFDDFFETQVHPHSTDASHRVFMVNCSRLGEFDARLRQADAVLMLEITGHSSLPDVRYELSRFVAYDPAVEPAPGDPVLLFPNTTTLVDVILNRKQTDKIAVITDGSKVPAPSAPAPDVAPVKTGRAALL